MRKKLGTLGAIMGAIAFTAVTAFSGCAMTRAFKPVTTQAFKPADTVDRVVDDYCVSVTREDRTGDQRYDAIICKKKDELMDILVINLLFVNEDNDETIDKVLGDFVNKGGDPVSDGVYDVEVDYDTFFERKYGRKPTEEDKKVDAVYKMLLKDFGLD